LTTSQCHTTASAYKSNFNETRDTDYTPVHLIVKMTKNVAALSENDKYVEANK